MYATRTLSLHQSSLCLARVRKLVKETHSKACAATVRSYDSSRSTVSCACYLQSRRFPGVSAPLRAIQHCRAALRQRRRPPPAASGRLQLSCHDWQRCLRVRGRQWRQTPRRRSAARNGQAWHSTGRQSARRRRETRMLLMHPMQRSATCSHCLHAAAFSCGLPAACIYARLCASHPTPGTLLHACTSAVLPAESLKAFTEPCAG